MMEGSELRAVQRMLIVQGGYVMLLGFVAGFGFVFYLIGSIELWPIPGKIAVQLPGTDKAWRMSHMEGVLNGLLLWLVAALQPAMALPVATARRIARMLVLTAWCFPIASLFDALFKDSRGLKFAAPVTNLIPFFLFYVGIIALVWAVVEIVVRVRKQV
ncbi:hypothetical protein [Novosphingobium sp.]|uniref:hypothetical protein n=1 Tax=Novosphingobium sp. TaxID=1874826 RepID=UPI003BAB8FC9